MSSSDALYDSVEYWLRSIRFQTLDYDDCVPSSSEEFSPLNHGMFCCGLFHSKALSSGNSLNASVVHHPHKVGSVVSEWPEEFEWARGWRQPQRCHSVIDSGFRVNTDWKRLSSPPLQMPNASIKIAVEPLIAFSCVAINMVVLCDDTVVIRTRIQPQYPRIWREQTPDRGISSNLPTICITPADCNVK